MSIEIQPMIDADLPFQGASKADISITIQSKPDEARGTDGETDQFNWMDLRDIEENFSLLLDAGEVVLEAAEAILVLSYPLEIAATRSIRPAGGKSFTRGELVTLIDETYREVYRLEANSQPSPTPPAHERGQFLNRPKSDGIFGIWGHDLDDLGIEKIDVYRIDGRIWLVPQMAS